MSKLHHGNSPNWVVQHEGWLKKRGAGWVPTSPNADIGISLPRTRLGLRRKAGTLRRGRAEKLRYFRLLASQPDKDGSITAAELRYYSDQPNPNFLENHQRGTIALKPGMEIQRTSESSFCLVTKNRTYYLRPNVPEEESNLAAARISAGQWISILQFVLKALSDDSPPSSMSHRPSAVDAEYQADMRRVDIMLVEARREKFEEFDRSDKPGLLAVMWVEQGLDAYDTIVDHFGPVKTDCQRLLAHFELSAEQLQRQLDLMQEYSYVSHDVSLREQRTMKVVIDQLNELSSKRNDVLRKCAFKLGRDVIQPIRRMMADTDTKLENIVKDNSNFASAISKYRRIVEASSRQVRRMASQGNLAFLADLDAEQLSSEPAQSAPGQAQHSRGQSAASVEARGSVGNVSQALNMIRKHSTPRRPSFKAKKKDPTEFTSSLQNQASTEGALRRVEQQNTAYLVAAIDALEDLHRKRLQNQKQLFLKAAKAESVMFEEMSTFLSDDSAIIAKFEGVDIYEDIKNTTERLLKVTQSTLPNF